MRVSLASILFACTLTMASAGLARAGVDGGDDGGQGGASGSASGGSGGAGGAVPIGIQPTLTPENLGCSAGGASPAPAPAGFLGLLIAGAALAGHRRRARRMGEEGVR